MRRTIRWRRWVASALLVYWCLLSVACAETSTNPRNDGGPPQFFTWNYNASVGATTPQEAYALSAHFTPCRMPDGMTTSPDQSVTWLVSGPDVGVVYLRATCYHAFHGNYLYRGFLAVAKGTFGGRPNAWDHGEVGEFHKQLPFAPTEDPPPPFAPLPPSVADLFPADQYIDWGPWHSSPPVTAVTWAGRAWVSLTPRDYVLALVKENVTRPPEASPTTIDGLPGWVTQANGMATIVAPRSDGAVVVFAGTGSASQVEALAARALPRADDALRDPTQSAITPTPRV
jgi:hypothetical protein